MENRTDLFISDIQKFTDKVFTQKNYHQAKRCLLDYLGATLAGAQLLNEKKENLITTLGFSNGNIKVIGNEYKTNLERAAFINGLYSHVAELDDGIISGIVHPGSPILSALIPYAEKENVNGCDFLKGVVVGYEVAARLADAIQPSHKMKGFHATASCGAIGGAVAISVMLNYSFKELKNAFSIAAVSAFGSLKVLEDNSQLKPYNVALAAQIAVISTAMAKADFNGPDDVLTGKTGFFEMVSDTYDLSFLDFKSNDTLAVDRVYIKPYAACRYCHPGIDAVFTLMNKQSIELENIKSIEVLTYSLAVKNHDHVIIDNISSAKMSIPYSVAVALLTGKAGLEQFTDKYIFNKEIVKLTKKIVVNESEEFTQLFPTKTGAEIVIKTNDGSIYKGRVEMPKGEPQTPLTDNELVEKYVSLAKTNTSKQIDTDKVLYTVWNLENEMSHLFDLL